MAGTIAGCTADGGEESRGSPVPGSGGGGATGSGGVATGGFAVAGGTETTGGAGATGGAVATGGTGATGGGGGIGANVVRDPCLWPFAADSIWNTPIGSSAVYVPAEIAAATEAGNTTDPDLIVMRPEAPLTNVYYNGSGWSGRDRCPAEGDLLLQVPLPVDFVIPSGPGTPNNGLAVLMPDGHTVKQTQPFARCAAGESGTSMYVFDDNDLFTDGILGSHGGSGMSALGGTLRRGELRPGKAAPRHALKGNLYAAMNLYRCTNEDDCSRWPAPRADGYALGVYGTLRDGIPSAVKMGALLALPASLDLNALGLQTEPARQLAWTLQNYGLYVVDDTYWDVWAIESEYGPDGDFLAQFEDDWGFGFESWSTTDDWASDMRTLFTSLAVVDNNGPTSVGGGGTPRQPPPPPLAPACGRGVGASDELSGGG